LFFGNQAFYIFFRLLQILFDRLSKAKHPGNDYVPKVNEMQRLLQPSRASRLEHDSADRYGAFKTKLLGLMHGDLGQVAYEDQCRELFGIDAYPLFTLDKLISMLTKQIASIVSDHTCTKLLNLHSYEYSRTNGFMESIYHANTIKTIRTDRCYRFFYQTLTPPSDTMDDDDVVHEKGRFAIRLLDKSHQPRFAELSFAQQQWSQYVKEFQKQQSSSSASSNEGAATTIVDSLDVQKHRIFLLRNRQSTIQGLGDVMKNVQVYNALECKICLSTYRLFYVEETEDYFYRLRSDSVSSSSSSSSTLSARAEKFRKWTDAKLAQHQQKSGVLVGQQEQSSTN